MNKPHQVGMSWTKSAFIIMGQEFGFVGRHVNVHGAIRLATFARQAKVQAFLYFLAVPAVTNNFTLEHLKEQPSTAPCGMAFLSRHHVARAHRARITSPTSADATATQQVFREIVPVVAVMKMRFRLPGIIIDSKL